MTFWKKWRRAHGTQSRKQPAWEIPTTARLQICGQADTLHWAVHAWLDRCPLPTNFDFHEVASEPNLVLHLQPLEQTLRENKLKELQQCPLVLDPDADQACQLQGLDVAAQWINPDGPSSGWLSEVYCEASIAEHLGLPSPSALRRHGEILYLGSLGDAWEKALHHPNWCLPGFDQILVSTSANARLLASWIQQCQEDGIALTRLNPTPVEQQTSIWEDPSPIKTSHQKTIRHAARLQVGQHQSRESHKGLESTLKATPESYCSTPRPSWSLLYEEETATEIQGCVCISLYNYKHRILNALDSIANQTERRLEVIVVDDCSQDEGADLVRQWLREHGDKFSRAILVRHENNSGLAASRNTGFALARAEWCFVLDADNALEPEALSLCLAIAEASPDKVAVVHPLVELRSEGRLPGQPSQALLSRISWQREALLRGNQIDAMALVRRKHWEEVGGYSHIPGGWEDYDFWCKLIEASHCGVICPQRLGIYNQHNQSMQATCTLKAHEELQALLQARHPWLHLTNSDKKERRDTRVS